MLSANTALVVDDDEKIAEMVSAVLRDEGFHVLTATSGLEGYASYFREPTCLVVTDIEMPGLNGVEMVHRIRAVNPDVKVIYMTAAIDMHDIALDNGGVGDANILRKPFSHHSLVGRISSLEHSVSSSQGV
jgi:two-component system, OmpR family, response regulator